MKKMILIGAFALLAACGGSDNDVSVGANDTSAPGGAATASDATIAGSDDASDATVADSDANADDGSDDTITVNDFSDMPAECIALLGQFLKNIEPTVSAVDWGSATMADFETIGTQFDAQSETFDTDLAAAGCDKYNLDTSDENQFEQIKALAAVEAPGTVAFLEFLNSLTSSSTDDGGEAVPTDCNGTIAAIEPFLSKGTMQDLTIAEVTQFGKLMTAVSTNCTPEENAAFFSRDDVTAFVGG
jgi:hypothetical protein